MADDVTLPGTAAVIATDEVSSRHYQLVKNAFGADGTATLVTPDVGLPTGAGSKVLTGSTTAYDTDAIASTDASGYQTISMILTGTYSAAVQLQGSNDNSNWVTLPTQAITSTPGRNDTSGIQSTDTVFVGAILTKYIRVRCSFYGSGTLNVAARLYNGAQGTIIPSSTTVQAGSGSNASDADTSSTWSAAKAFNQGFNGVSWDRHRLSKIFKSAAATASGDTAVWTPASGKKFQLQRFQLFLTANAATSSGAVITVKLRDATTTTGIEIPVYVPAAGGTLLGGWQSGWIDIGPYGYRSSTNNNVLNVNLSAALSAGSLGVVACGTEE